MIYRDIKRGKLNKKFNSRRIELRKVVASLSSSEDEKEAAVATLQSLPRDSSKSRQRNRCNYRNRDNKQCGRSRGFNRLTGLCRIHMREAVMNGLVPGMHKSSW